MKKALSVLSFVVLWPVIKLSVLINDAIVKHEYRKAKKETLLWMKELEEESGRA